MKSFRHILITTLLTLCTFGIALFTSCKNKCGTTTCQNGGTCSNNVCACPTGYSGNSCQTGWSDVFIGTYNCSRNSCLPAVTGVNSWVSSVTKSVTDGGFTINISNFDNSNTTIVATIDSTRNLTIKPAAGSYGVNASGNYSNGKINLDFTTTSAGGTNGYTCKMVMIKE